jgi:membrane-bound lytic murein transglycosylase B
MPDTLPTRPAPPPKPSPRCRLASPARLAGLLALLALALVLTVAVPARPARAQDTLLGADDPSSTVLAELNSVAVTGDEVDAAVAQVHAVLADIDAAEAAQAGAITRQADLAAALVALEQESGRLVAARDAEIIARNTAVGDAEEARGRVQAHQGEAAVAEAVLRDVAAEAYIGAGGGVEVVVTGAELSGVAPARVKGRYLSDVFDDQWARRGAELGARDRAAAEQRAAEERAAGHDAARLELEAAMEANAAAIAGNGADTVAAVQAQLDAEAEQERLAGVLVETKASLAEARRTGTVVGADFPLVVLDAFVRAEQYEAANRPGCGLGWQLLAAISRVESRHGTASGGAPDARGDTPAIFGPQLSPGSGFATLDDSDAGLLDGDPLYDRAVGPMQFIPSSWRIFGLDGNDDGAVDPANYYDAALAAAEHLCRSGADVATAAGLRQAVLGYNNSETYLAQISSLTDRYRQLSW